MIDLDSKAGIDLGAIGVYVGAVLGWLPEIATLFTIIWLALRIYESPTVQRWLGR